MGPAISLLCPICSEPLTRSERSYLCAKRHNFDLSKDGYLSLLQGKDNYANVGDDAEMIQARVTAHALPPYFSLAQAVANLASPLPSGARILDLGCGDGFYLHHFASLAAQPLTAAGVDIAKKALGRAARKQPGALFIRSDAAHKALPFPDTSFDRVLSIFAPRPVAEIHRVLADDGLWLVVTATPDHLKELRDFLPLAGIGTDKLAKMSDQHFSLRREETLQVSQRVTQAEMSAVIEMSPSIYRLRREFEDKWRERLPASLDLTFSFSLSLLGKA
jgi:23S rRNA (guanine745-N1)-methyltransferase